MQVQVLTYPNPAQVLGRKKPGAGAEETLHIRDSIYYITDRANTGCLINSDDGSIEKEQLLMHAHTKENKRVSNVDHNRDTNTIIMILSDKSYIL